MVLRAKGEGTVYFDAPRAKFVVKVPIGQTPAGTTRYKKAQATTRREANALRLTLIAERDNPTAVAPSALTFRQFSEHHFAHEANLQLRPTSIGNYLYVLRKWAYPNFGDKPLTGITSTDIGALLTSLAGTNSTHFVNHCRATISHVFEAALAHRLVEDNPVRRTRKVKSTTAQPTLVRQHWSLEECRAALIASLGTPHALFVHLAVYTGMRHGELMGLMWQDFDLENATVTVNRTLVELRSRLDPTTPRLRFNEPKTPKSQRTLQLPDVVIAIAKNHLAEQEAHRANAGRLWADYDLVFPTRLGQPVPTSNHARAFKRFLASAGLRDIRVHDIRHSFATNALELGVDLPSISRALGHSSLHMTMDIYAKGATGIQNRATEGLANGLNKQ